MTILITGGNGQLAFSLQQYANNKNIKILSLGQHQLDICRADQIEAIFSHHSIQYVVNTAAYTAVDQAETEQQKAYAINRDAVGVLATACQEKDIPLIHLSTDYVFNGKSEEAYQENSLVSPINIYGDSKWQGECQVKEKASRHVILRVSSVFGCHGHNFVKTMLRLMQQKSSISVVSDQVSCPTSATAIAEVIFKIIEKLGHGNGPWGTYHYCHQQAVSWYQFALSIMAIAKNHHRQLSIESIEPILTKDYPLPAERPLHSVLDCAKIKRDFAVEQTSYYSQLEKVIKQYAP